MVATAGEKVWYSDDGSGTIGYLDPSVASGTTHILSSPTESPVTPACSQVQPSSNPVINSSSGTLSWSDAAYSIDTGPAGVRTYQMPSGASPWGITVYDEETWVVDNGRQVLVRLPPVKEYFVYLPMVRR
jgi:streptogramin lyase